MWYFLVFSHHEPSSTEKFRDSFEIKLLDFVTTYTRHLLHKYMKFNMKETLKWCAEANTWNTDRNSYYNGRFTLGAQCIRYVFDTCTWILLSHVLPSVNSEIAKQQLHGHRNMPHLKTKHNACATWYQKTYQIYRPSRPFNDNFLRTLDNAIQWQLSMNIRQCHS